MAKALSVNSQLTLYNRSLRMGESFEIPARSTRQRSQNQLDHLNSPLDSCTWLLIRIRLLKVLLLCTRVDASEKEVLLTVN